MPSCATPMANLVGIERRGRCLLDTELPENRRPYRLFAVDTGRRSTLQRRVHGRTRTETSSGRGATILSLCGGGPLWLCADDGSRHGKSIDYSGESTRRSVPLRVGSFSRLLRRHGRSARWRRCRRSQRDPGVCRRGNERRRLSLISGRRGIARARRHDRGRGHGHRRVPGWWRERRNR